MPRLQAIVRIRDPLKAVYVFLASDQGSFISGRCLSVDGGAVPGT